MSWIKTQIEKILGGEKPEKVVQYDNFRNDPKYSPKAGSWGQSMWLTFDGEKNLGELGSPINYSLNNPILSVRSWQSYLESELTKTIIDKYVLWMIDGGLKLQSNPADRVLQLNGLSIDPEVFNDDVEALFSIWSHSRASTFDGVGNLNTTAEEAYKQSKLAGDVLVVLRLDDNHNVKVQLIDGAHLSSPVGMQSNGNKVVQGVEIDKNGNHVAFHVKESIGDYKRIPAKLSNGLTSAFLVYGSKYRVGNVRGYPIISAALETVKKLERYKEAVVGSAEERQKIAYQIVHGVHSSGENPLFDQIAAATDVTVNATEDLPKDEEGIELANHVAASTNKMTFNMPNDAELKTLESKNELYFKEFYETNAYLYCASVGIPPNVAFSLYNDSFSASRTATKDWEHTMLVERKKFSFQFYQRIYDFWLHVQILKNKVQAPGYLKAFQSDDFMILDSYRRARFTGTMFPHIDPLKEVNAERAKLGEAGKHIPLSTVEAATENLNGGDSKSNIEQFAKELEKVNELKIEAPQKKQEPTTTKKDESDED